MRTNDLRRYVIQPTLNRFGYYSQAAENLLVGTVSQESRLGEYLHQVNGPALGIYQIEPATHRDIWLNYLIYRPELGERVALYASTGNVDLGLDVPVDDVELITNLAYATIIARLVYYRAPTPLPEANDLQGMAKYWKEHYNTMNGKGSIEEYMRNYDNR